MCERNDKVDWLLLLVHCSLIVSLMTIITFRGTIVTLIVGEVGLDLKLKINDIARQSASTQFKGLLLYQTSSLTKLYFTHGMVNTYSTCQRPPGYTSRNTPG